jgi:signal peptidase I
VRLRRGGDASPKKEKSAGGQLLELVLIVAVALGLALLIQAVLVKPYRIPSESMLPTLKVGQRVLVNRIGNRFNDPEIGEIVVFHPPQGADEQQCGNSTTGDDTGSPCSRPNPRREGVNFIKRVVAGPGDRIAIDAKGHVVLNGKVQRERFVIECPSDCSMPKAITVPPGHWFMMGDNRGESDDSRYWGPVPKKWIIGGAFATYWPLSRIGFL